MSRKRNRFASIVMVGSVLAAPFTASAAPITYDFIINASPSGPLADVIANGFFTFDSRVVADADPDNFAIVSGPALFQDFQLTWNGINYLASNITTSYLQFQFGVDGVTDQLDALGFGTTCAADGACSVIENSNQWFFDGSVEFQNSFVYGLPDVAGIFRGSLSFRRREANVPEPVTLGLMGLGLLGLGVARRQHA